MFPPQTSFIPVAVALARYVEAHGFAGNYPFWYLGTTPVKYLTGPVVPGILIGLHKIFPSLSFFDLSYFIILASFFIHAAGWGLLAAKLSADKKVGWWVGVLMLFAPFHIFWNLAFGEVSAVAAAALTPWVLLGFRVWGLGISQASSMLTKPYTLVPIALFALLLLINTTAAVPAMMGLAVLGVISYKRWEDGLKSAAIVVLGGFLIATIWYGPAYWLTIATSSSIGGRSAFGAFIWILNMLRSFVPIILALAVVLWGFKPKGQYWRFVIAWTSVFVLLTFLRFFANPAFWLDWTAWVGEVEIGLVLVAAKYVSSIKYFVLRDKLKILAFCLLLIVCYFFAFQNREFWLPRKSIENSVEYRISSQLSGMMKPSETVLLSGSTAFWLNSLYDIRQVRGGRDEVSVDPSINSGQANWQENVWKIRQGDSDQAEEALMHLNAGYLVVHSESSGEFYHDFKNVEKFNQIKSLEQVYEQDGDIIYYVNHELNE